MDRKELEKRQKEVLNKVCESCLANEITAGMAPGEEVGSSDMLLVQHTETGKEIDEILGTYYFLPAAKEIGAFQYFVSSLTLCEEVPKRAVGSLATAIAIINSMMYFGTFTMSSDGSVLAYRHVTLLPEDADFSLLVTTVQGTMLNVLAEVAIWADELDALQYGRITLEEFVKYCGEVHTVFINGKQ